MRNVTIKGLLAHKLRLALTSLAIVLGVTFISGSFVLTDTLHNLFDGLVGNIYQKIDFQVRGVAQFPTSDAANAVRNPLPEQVLATVRRVPGVERRLRGGLGVRPVPLPPGHPDLERGRNNPRHRLRPGPTNLRAPPCPGEGPVRPR